MFKNNNNEKKIKRIWLIFVQSSKNIQCKFYAKFFAFVASIVNNDHYEMHAIHASMHACMYVCVDKGNDFQLQFFPVRPGKRKIYER